MIKHIVVWEFSEAGKSEQIQKMKALLEELPSRIPEIKSYEVGINIVESERSKDMVLISEFENLEALKRYSEHPEHQRVVQELRQTDAKAIAIDFKV